MDRSKDENFLVPEVDFHVGKKQLKQILEKCIAAHGATGTAETMDNIKALGYKYSTRAAMTVSISDMTVPEAKKDILAEAQKTVELITDKFNMGLLTEEERYKAVINTWYAADNQLTEALMSGLDRYNNIFMMVGFRCPWFSGTDQAARRYAWFDGRYIRSYDRIADQV